MHKANRSKSLIIMALLTLSLQPTYTQAEPGFLAQVNQGIGTTLHGIVTGTAVGGLLVGTYQWAKALHCWIKAENAETTHEKDELLRERNESFNKGFTALLLTASIYIIQQGIIEAQKEQAYLRSLPARPVGTVVRRVTIQPAAPTVLRRTTRVYF